MSLSSCHILSCMCVVFVDAYIFWKCDKTSNSCLVNQLKCYQIPRHLDVQLYLANIVVISGTTYPKAST